MWSEAGDSARYSHPQKKVITGCVQEAVTFVLYNRDRLGSIGRRERFAMVTLVDTTAPV